MVNDLLVEYVATRHDYSFNRFIKYRKINNITIMYFFFSITLQKKHNIVLYTISVY